MGLWSFIFWFSHGEPTKEVGWGFSFLNLSLIMCQNVQVICGPKIGRIIIGATLIYDGVFIRSGTTISIEEKLLGHFIGFIAVEQPERVRRTLEGWSFCTLKSFRAAGSLSMDFAVCFFFFFFIWFTMNCSSLFFTWRLVRRFLPALIYYFSAAGLPEFWISAASNHCCGMSISS